MRATRGRHAGDTTPTRRPPHAAPGDSRAVEAGSDRVRADPLTGLATAAGSGGPTLRTAAPAAGPVSIPTTFRTL